VTAANASGETAQASVAIRSTAVTLSLQRPAAAPWRAPVVLRGRLSTGRAGVAVNVYRGSVHVARTLTRPGGAFAARLRLDVPGRYHVRSGDVRSAEVAVLAVPRLTTTLAATVARGEPLRLRTTLRPASAGRLEARVGTRWRALRGPLALRTATVGPVRVTVRLRPRPGFLAASRTLTARVVEPNLQQGSTGPAVRELERRLVDLRYALQRVDGSYGLDTTEAVYAFQRLHGLEPTGRVDAALWRALARAAVPAARLPGTHIEVDKSRQVLLDVRNGIVVHVVHVSTGATGNTPLGTWHVYRKVPGFDWVLYYPLYFLRGFAIHGYPSVPPYPASHGCVRVPMWLAQSIYDAHGYGTTIVIY
jgi:N-acetylmuramoyl-L-alanine amidase